MLKDAKAQTNSPKAISQRGCTRFEIMTTRGVSTTMTIAPGESTSPASVAVYAKRFWSMSGTSSVLENTMKKTMNASAKLRSFSSVKSTTGSLRVNSQLTPTTSATTAVTRKATIKLD